MNGADCGECGNIQCTCPRESEGEKALKLLSEFDNHTETLYQVLIKPKGIRLRLIRWLYPEIVKVADSLRRCYWSQ